MHYTLGMKRFLEKKIVFGIICILFDKVKTLAILSIMLSKRISTLHYRELKIFGIFKASLAAKENNDFCYRSEMLAIFENSGFVTLAVSTTKPWIWS